MARTAPRRLIVTDGFRTAAQQAAVRARKPELAAKGRSKHEDGLAIDVEGDGWEAEAWVAKNAPLFGLRNPRRDEPWHLEVSK